MTLEELQREEQAALIACEESDNEPPLVDRYLEAQSARQEAEQSELTPPPPNPA